MYNPGPSGMKQLAEENKITLQNGIFYLEAYIFNFFGLSTA
jgi:hypothetical protein